MNRFAVIVSVFVVMLAAFGCSHYSKKLVGTWEMIYPEADAPVADDSDKHPYRPIKILNETHFAFGRQEQDGTVFAGGGRYFLKGNSYTEIIWYHSMPVLVGKVITFECKLEGDTWHHTGMFEEGGNKVWISEIWRRVK